MDVAVLVTNGGPHPADKWAALVSSRIADLIQVDELSDSDGAALARKAKPRFAIALSDALEPIFNDAMGAEVAAVDAGTVTLRHAAFSVGAFVDSAASAVIAESVQFSEHFEAPNVTAVVRNILTQTIIDAANIARSWALDAKGL